MCRLLVVVRALSHRRSVLREASIEVSPSGASRLIELSHEPRRVFVNMIERDPTHFDDVVDAVRLLSDHGYDAVPHVPASLLRDAEDAERVLKLLAEAGARMPLIVGGNAEQENNLTAEDVAAVACPLFQRLAFAAFPEGHPRTTREEGDAILRAKIARFPGSAIVTQWSWSNYDRVLEWIDQFCENHENSEVHAGAVGPAKSREQLLRFAEFCGIEADDDATDPPSLEEIASKLPEHNHNVRLHVFPLGIARSLNCMS